MLTEPDSQDNLPSKRETYQVFTGSEAIERFLKKAVDFMVKKQGNTKELDKIETETEASEIDDNDLAWHCYFCGYTWVPHDRTNPDPTEYQCAGCDRYGWYKISLIGRHDPNCPRCLKKKKKYLKLLEKLQKS